MACAPNKGCCGHAHEEHTHDDDDVQLNLGQSGGCCAGATKDDDNLKPAETT